MRTYLLTWNPERWKWTDIRDSIAEIDKNGFCDARWSTGVTKKIVPGDRVFLMKLGASPKGIVGSGWATSMVFEDTHWMDESRTALYVDIDFDTLLNPDEDSIFPIELLDGTIYGRVNWTPQASGMSIPDNVAKQLEKDWARFLNRGLPVRHIHYADEIDDGKTYPEGMLRQVYVNVYERNPEARAICLNKYGTRCAVCGFDFGKAFGDIGAGFIHVHHLKPLSKIHEGYKIDPIKDLQPVCPNCHAMLHQRKPTPYTIAELKAILLLTTKRD